MWFELVGGGCLKCVRCCRGGSATGSGNADSSIIESSSAAWEAESTESIVSKTSGWRDEA
jgi:hypothetical protein